MSFCLSDKENFVSLQEISLELCGTQETFEKFPFSPQLLWLSPHWQSSIQLYSGKLWIFTKCHLNWHFLTFKRSLVENSENSSLKCFWCHLICLQSLNLKWKMFCDNLLLKLRLWRGCSFLAPTGAQEVLISVRSSVRFKFV